METFISRPNALAPFTFILAVLPLPSDILQILVQHAEQQKIPTFYVHSIGFYAHFTAQIPSAFPIVDTHPDPASTSDLRLLEPWSELSQFAGSTTMNLEQMPDDEHGHVPYILLLLYYLDKWRADHNGSAPTSFKDKTAFRDQVRSGLRTTSSAGDEENYEEAVGAVLKTISPHSPGNAVKEVLTAPEARDLTVNSSNFWIIAHAVNEFYVKNGVLPLSGSLPDMKAKSHDYVALQNIYRAKAQADVATVTSHVLKIEQELGREQMIPKDEISAFCKNAGSVKLLRGSSPQLAKPTAWRDRASAMAMQLTMPDSLLPLYIAFLAYDNYATKHGIDVSVGFQRGDTDDSLDVEADKIVGITSAYVDGLLKEAGEHLDDPEYSQVKEAAGNCARELVRANGAELHNVSAVMGGVVAQEAIKVITEQYIPVDNTCLFDGIASKMSVLRT